MGCARFFLFLVLSLAVLDSAQAVILFGGSNPANETDPGGLPWNNVVEIQKGTGDTTGSGVYLGNQFVLTAAHVEVAQINIGGTLYYVDTGFNFGGYVNGIQTVGSADLKLIRLTLTPPGMSAVQIYSGGFSDFGVTATYAGYGVGNGSEISGQGWNWGDSTTDGVKRWGTNVATGYYPAQTVEGYTSNLMETTFDSTGGASEFALADHDSGGGLFFNLSGTWYLTGIGAYVENGGVSYYDEGNANDPDSNYFIRLAAYKSTINGMIAVPEPGTVPLVALSGMVFVVVAFLRKKKYSV